jgi:hypothetical protein
MIGLLLAAGPVEAKKSGKKSSGFAIVVNPAGAQSQDPALTLTQTEMGGVLGGVEIRSSVVGTNHWVHLPMDLPSGIAGGKQFFVVGVEVCHLESADAVQPPTSFIDTIRVTKLESPLGSEIEHEDTTDFFTTTPLCVQSPVPFPFPIEGALTLSLNLSFGKPDDVVTLGAIRILLSTQSLLVSSPPSEPSLPSAPSAPSGPSEPSEPSEDDD